MMTTIQKRIPFPNGHGGNRKHDWARKQRRRGVRCRVPHRVRRGVRGRFPVHVTMRVGEDLANLRRPAEYRVVRKSIWRGNRKPGFRVNHYSVQSNHLHLLVEAHGRRELSRGMQGLLIRIAKGLNRLWRRRGSVFADRYFDRILKSRREVRNALAYVLNNARKHGIFTRGHDPYSSAERFDGWRERPSPRTALATPWLPRAHTWLLRIGWRRYGLISATHTPGS